VAAKAGLHCARVKVPSARASSSTCMQPLGRGLGNWGGGGRGRGRRVAEAGGWQWRDNGRRQGDCSVTDVAQGGERACTRKALTRALCRSGAPSRLLAGGGADVRLCEIGQVRKGRGGCAHGREIVARGGRTCVCQLVSGRRVTCLSWLLQACCVCRTGGRFRPGAPKGCVGVRGSTVLTGLFARVRGR